MSDTNIALLTGNLTRTPELRYTPNGVAVANFGLASNRRYRQGDDMKEEVCFVDVTVFGATGEAVAKYLDKGVRRKLHSMSDSHEGILASV